MYSEDLACFEDDKEQINFLAELLLELDKMDMEVSGESLKELWNSVAASAKAIEKEQQSLPSHDALSKSIAQERARVKAAEEDLEDVKRLQEYAINEYNKVEQSQTKLFAKELPTFSEEAVMELGKENMQSLLGDYVDDLLKRKRTLEQKRQKIRSQISF